MVTYTQVQQSNARISDELPPGLVAVFVGGTNGIGEYTLRQFAASASQPRVYFIGRSQEAGDRIARECKAINQGGTFNFIQADTSLIKNVDEICRSLKAKEKVINLLFLTVGTLDFYKNTSEGLRLVLALTHYGRARFIQNLLPELQAATSLKRVVNVFAATKEGPFDVNDINGDRISLAKARGHASSLITCGMETLANKAPDVSFIHSFPGPVTSGIGRDMPGILGYIVRFLGKITAPFLNIPTNESGAFNLFCATSARFPPSSASVQTSGVALVDGVGIARGTNGTHGGGMYSIDERGESASPAVEKLLVGFKNDGVVEKVWEHTETEWRRITNS